MNSKPQELEVSSEYHPLRPFLPQGCCLLMLGSFPPARKRWAMEFFYPNFINDMWRIFGICFFGDKQHFVDEANRTFRRQEIEQLLTEQGIGLFDTATVIRRLKNTASDKDLEVVQPTDLTSLLQQIPQCQAVCTTGQKATDLFCAHFGIQQPQVGGSVEFMFQDRHMRHYRMPSSSRAYPMKVERKAEAYRSMFAEVLPNFPPPII